MTHPGEGTLQALLDDELGPGERRSVERHVGACDRCSEELELLREQTADLSTAVRLLDVPVSLDQARWRLEGRRRRRSPGVGRTVRRAALLVLGSAAVLSATVPGSPVREWLVDSRAPARLEPAAPLTELEPAPAAVEPTESYPAGVSLRPTQPMRVVLAGPATGVRVRVTLHDGERVGVWTTEPAAQARFRTAPNRIEVEGAEAGEVRIEIPRAGPSLTLEVNGRVYLRRDGQGLTFPGPAADTVGPEIVFEVRP